MDITGAETILERLFAWDSLMALGAIFGLLCLSGLFSGSETALTAVSRALLHRRASDGDQKAAMVLALVADRERLIGGILLGNNLVNILASAIATSLFLSVFGDAGVALATALMTALVLIFAEVLPKTYAILHTEKMATTVAPVIRIFVWIFAPIVSLVQILVRRTLRLFGAQIEAHDQVLGVHDELRGTVEMHTSNQDSAAKPTHREVQRNLTMVGGVLDLRDMDVTEVMVHRKDIFMIDGAMPADVLVSEVLKAPHTRIPIFKDDQENIIGVLHAKDLLRSLAEANWDAGKVSVEDCVRTPWFVPDTTTLQIQLNAFLENGTHFAFVVDEYGTLMGLLTLEDILEEIVGNITDEHDEPVEGVRPQPDGTYNVNGTVPIRDLNRALGWRLPEEEAITIAGLVIHEAQTIPDEGQCFNFYGFTFEILRRNRNQVTAMRVIPPEDLRGRKPVRKPYLP